MCESNEKNDLQAVHVFKFGGSCFKTDSSFIQSLKIVDLYKKEKLIIVCSALFGITNKLIEFGNAAYEPGDIPDAPERFLSEIRVKHIEFIDSLLHDNTALHHEMVEFVDSKLEDLRKYSSNLKEHGMQGEFSDYVVSFGERMSAYLYTRYLLSKGFKAEFVAPDEEFLITDDEFGNALPILAKCEENIRRKLIPLLNDNVICVVPGFYGSTEDGRVSTLGRGGSDFTTTIIGYSIALDFNVSVVFWKDVYGILSANPKYVSNAQLLNQLSYAEAKEMAYFGTKILHPMCLKMAEQRDVTAEIRNFDDPSSENYTQITQDCIIPGKSNDIIKGITSLDQISMITVESDAMISLPGSAAKIFSIMGENGININFISQCSSENNITFGTSLENGNKASKLLTQNKYFGKRWFKVNVDQDMALLSVVGAGMTDKPGVAGLLFSTIGNAGINIRAISQGSSEMNITLIIPAHNLKRAIKTIYKTFIQGNIPTKIHSW